jgi:acetyl esterase/lipase
VHIHGGGWIAGGKGRFYTRPLARLADAGHPVFSLNYPLAPESPHPEPLRALLRGLAWIRRTEANGGSVHLVGDSAGANLAMMLALLLSDPETLRLYDSSDPLTLPAILSVTSIYGVLDRISAQEDGFPGFALFLRSYAGPGAVLPTFPTTMPITPMDMPDLGRLPPAFIVAGGKDKLARSSRLFFDRAVKDAPDIRTKLYPGADHGFFNFGPGSAELGHDLAAFLSDVEMTGPGHP